MLRACLRLGVRGVGLSSRRCGVQGGLPRRGAADKLSTLNEGRPRGTGDRELALDGGDVGVNVSTDRDGLVGLRVNVVEEVGSLKGILARSGESEVVCRRDCSKFSGQSKDNKDRLKQTDDRAQRTQSGRARGQ